jgi:transcriptional regulator with XRE-family HTH domain
MDIRVLVGQNLRRLRLVKGLSQEGLAFEAEIDRTYVSGLERGLENPTILVLSRLAGVLGCEASLLLMPAPKGEPEPGPLPTGPKPQPKRRKA